MPHRSTPDATPRPSSRPRRLRTRGRSGLIAAGGLAAGALLAAAPGALAAPVCAVNGSDTTCTYAYSGAAEEFTVPAGVTELRVELLGAAGGASTGPSAAPGGKGAAVTATVPVTPGQVLQVRVGGAGGGPGSSAPGFNGGGGLERTGSDTVLGGGGGGASDIRTGASLDTRLVVAGGGGGAGGDGMGADVGLPAGGGGGDSGADGGIGESTLFNTGGESENLRGGRGGTAGTASAAGTPSGDLGQGGTPSVTLFSAGGIGGGGGGGCYGGGAGDQGEAAGIVAAGGGGGGGGSSCAADGVTGLSVSEGQNAGAGRVAITYTIPEPPPVLPAFSVRDTRIAEGDSGTRALRVSVCIDRVPTRVASVKFKTRGATATSGNDYLYKETRVYFQPGETTACKTVAVTIRGDRRREADETFTALLSYPHLATIADDRGTQTIRNDD